MKEKKELLDLRGGKGEREKNAKGGQVEQEKTRNLEGGERKNVTWRGDWEQ